MRRCAYTGCNLPESGLSDYCDEHPPIKWPPEAKLNSFTESEMKLGNHALKLGGLSEDAQFTRTTYWTCFAYEGILPDTLHCTHKYLGDQTPEAVEQITAILDAYFVTPFDTRTTPTIIFKREEFFGPNKDVRVLRPESDDVSWFFLDLRKQLDAFAEDRYPELKPHVTTNLDAVMAPFVRYCLCQGDKILAEYQLN